MSAFGSREQVPNSLAEHWPISSVGKIISRAFHEGDNCCYQTLLAPSPRIAAYLARKGHPMPAMALTAVEPLADRKDSQQGDKQAFVAPPDVVTTPCDPLLLRSTWYLEDGLRKVHPYHYTYNTYCKERWRGRELLDIFATEFRDRPLAYYVRNS